jgi:hypothetical protein
MNTFKQSVMEIKEIRFDRKIPSIAYTDFLAIYLFQFLYKT